MIELAVVMPLYNEEASIELVVDKWVCEFERLQINFELHAYNDGSKDNSWELLKQLAEKYPALKIHNKVNTGHGPTILLGYREQCHIPWLFQIDSDDELDIMGFEDMWQSKDNYDFLIGNRGNRNSPLARQIITLFTWLTTTLFYGRGIHDINSPFRLMRSVRFKDLFHKIPEDTFAPNVIISGFVAAKKLRYKEVPIVHQFRRAGEVSIKKWKLLKAALRSFWQTIKFRGHL
jgi:glycosyltransferase involved in cell wall biosynthesis